MKGLTTIALFMTLGAVAVAKPGPVEVRSAALNDSAVNIGVAGTTLERGYFQAPQAQFNAGGFPCRVPLVVFDKTRLASSCH